MTLIYWKAGLQAPKQKSDEKKEWADSTVLIPHLQWRYKISFIVEISLWLGEFKGFLIKVAKQEHVFNERYCEKKSVCSRELHRFLKLGLLLGFGEVNWLFFPLLTLSHFYCFFPLQRRRAQSASKIVEKLKRRLAEQEAALLLAIPSLPVTLYHKQGKVSCICL